MVEIRSALRTLAAVGLGAASLVACSNDDDTPDADPARGAAAVIELQSEPCDLLAAADVAEVLGVDAETVTAQADEVRCVLTVPGTTDLDQEVGVQIVDVGAPDALRSLVGEDQPLDGLGDEAWWGHAGEGPDDDPLRWASAGARLGGAGVLLSLRIETAGEDELRDRVRELLRRAVDRLPGDVPGPPPTAGEAHEGPGACGLVDEGALADELDVPLTTAPGADGRTCTIEAAETSLVATVVVTATDVDALAEPGAGDGPPSIPEDRGGTATVDPPEPVAVEGIGDEARWMPLPGEAGDGYGSLTARLGSTTIEITVTGVPAEDARPLSEAVGRALSEG